MPGSLALSNQSAAISDDSDVSSHGLITEVFGEKVSTAQIAALGRASEEHREEIEVARNGNQMHVRRMGGKGPARHTTSSTPVASGETVASSS
jgi:hypothetical protein